MKDFKTNLKGFVLLLALALIFPLSANAQYYKGSLLKDDPTAAWEKNQSLNNRDFAVIWAATTQDFNTPLGTGLLIMFGAGAGYALLKKKEEKK